MFFFGYGVVHGVLAPGMAAEDAFGSHVSPFKYSPFLDSLNGVMRAGRLVPALVDAQQRRYQQLVGPDRQYEQLF